MKNAFAILFASLILLSGMHLTIASHICCGELAAVTYSFTGEKATCGMEDSESQSPVNGAIQSDCCKDHLSSCSADNNYFPSFHKVKELASETTPLTAVLPDFFISSPILSKTYYSMVGPPVKEFHTSVDPSFLCVFII